MTKNGLQKLKGFRDFLPEEAKKRAWLKEQMARVFEKWGYEPLETPTLEPLGLFAGQIGEEEKLFFKFTDPGGRDVALRYDQTVPTCRVLGEYAIPLPFRRYQIQSAFRAEKPQKGRYREFTQADIDIFGVSSPLADAEIIACTLDLYKELGFKEVAALINNRDLMAEVPYPALAAIDKLGKISEEGVVSEMTKKGIPDKKAKSYLSFVKNLKPDKTLKTIFEYLENSGVPKSWYKFAPTLARAFSYSQGPIWEIVIPEYSGGSVGGGERYDAMIESISGKKIPGTGIGIGFDRTLEALEECGLMPKFASVAKVLVSVFSPSLMTKSLKIASNLRTKSINCEIYPDPQVKIDKQFKYADKKQIAFVVIIGPEEIKEKLVTLKNMKTGDQQKVQTQKLAEIITSQ